MNNAETKQSRIIGIIEVIIGFLILVFFGSKVNSALSGEIDATISSTILQIIVCILGFGLVFYGLKEYNDNSNKALVPLYIWAVVVIGIVAVFITNIVSILNNPSDWYILFEPLLYLWLGVYAINAYINNKPTLISLLTSYIVLYNCSTLVAVILQIVYGGVSFPIVTLTLRGIWGGGWLIYLVRSSKLLSVYPKDTRVTSRLGYTIVSLYIIAIVILLFAGFSNETVDEEVSASDYIEQINNELPIETSSGELFSSIELTDNEIVCNYILLDVTQEEIDSEWLSVYSQSVCEQEKFQIINGTSSELYNYSEGRTVTYSYSDTLGRKILTYSISPEEYTLLNTGGYNYRTGDSILESMILYFSSKTPYYIFDEVVVDQISYDKEADKLIYTLRLPYTENLKSYTKSYLQNYLNRNWYSISDELFIILGLNQIKCEFDFKTSTNLDWTKFTIIPPKAFNNE